MQGIIDPITHDDFQEENTQSESLFKSSSFVDEIQNTYSQRKLRQSQEYVCTDEEGVETIKANINCETIDISKEKGEYDSIQKLSMKRKSYKLNKGSKRKKLFKVTKFSQDSAYFPTKKFKYAKKLNITQEISKKDNEITKNDNFKNNENIYLNSDDKSVLSSETLNGINKFDEFLSKYEFEDNKVTSLKKKDDSQLKLKFENKKIIITHKKIKKLDPLPQKQEESNNLADNSFFDKYLLNNQEEILNDEFIPKKKKSINFI